MKRSASSAELQGKGFSPRKTCQNLMETLEAPSPKSYKAIQRQLAEKILAEAGRGAGRQLELDKKRHPAMEGIPSLKEFSPLVLLEEFDADSYYGSILPWHRAPDRAKDFVVSHFESLCGRMPEGMRKSAAEGIGSGAMWIGLCAVDGEGKRWFVPVEKGQAREVKLSSSQSSAYEAARSCGALSGVPRLS